MKKSILGVMVSATLVAAGLAGCSSSESASTTQNNTEASTSTSTSAGSEDGAYSVRIAAVDSGVGIYKAIAEANNLAEGLDLDVEWVEGLSSGPEIIAAIAGESVDVGKIGDFPVVTNYGSGEKPVFKVIGYAVRGTDSLVFTSADSGIDTLESLKGKTIGTQIGTGSQFQLQTSLAKAGLTIDDVNLVNLDNGSWLSAFTSGDVDAICILTDVTVGNEELGEINRLDETELAIQSFIANEEWAEANPEAAARTLILFHEVLEYYAANPDEAIEQVLAAYPEASSERVKFILDELTDTLLDGSWDTAVSRYTDLKKFALEAGSIENDFDVEDVYDSSYVEKAKEINANLK
jgi:ABC-type nitrate/sulfonate/bicarbonate transport system substrate-binding protein